MAGKPVMQLSQPAQPQAQPQQQQQQQQEPAATVRTDSPAARTPSPPNRGAPTFNGRNWL